MNNEIRKIEKNSLIKVGAVVLRNKKPIYFENKEAKIVKKHNGFNMLKINRFNSVVYFWEFCTKKTNYKFKN